MFSPLSEPQASPFTPHSEC